MFVANNQTTVRNNVVDNSAAGVTVAKPLLDLTSLSKMIGQNKVAQVLTIYLRDAPKEIQLMKAAFEERAVDKLYNMAHKLKGSSGLIKANNVFVLLQQIEIVARSGKVNESVKMAIEAVDCEYKKLEPMIQAELNRLID